ncbi:MAG: phosphoenolpyruvate--protein phosphotransferase [Rhodospirillales bacterium]
MAEKETIFEGFSVSPGIGVGTAFVRESGAIAAPKYRITRAKTAAEIGRLKRAVAATLRQIGRVRAKLKGAPKAAEEEMSYLFDAYEQMLKNSRLIRGAERRIESDRINAEAAIQEEVEEIAKTFANMEDSYIAARIDDIRDVGIRVVRNLTKVPVRPFAHLPKRSIVIADSLTPEDSAQLDPTQTVGVAMTLGGAEGHTAIMLRALGLPAVLGAEKLLQHVRSNDPVIVDGDHGRVIVNPKPETLAAYERRRAVQQRKTRQLSRLRDQPSETRDGMAISLQANVELPMEMDLVMQTGAEGVGLLRSEFMFMNRNDFPSEEEQYRALRDMIRPMKGKTVTVRTLDIGGEKAAAQLYTDLGDLGASPLGLRGIRLSLARPDVLETQFRAMLRASVHGSIRVLLPMVTTVTEVRRARDIMARAARRLKRRGVPIKSPLPPIGAMIEVPSAALAADSLSQASDFLAIGSNDLTMYTLAIDRADERVAHLYDPLHPAVLRLIQFSAEAALRARIPVCMCGEMAGDPRFTALLLGLGFRDLSMTASNIPRVKQRIRQLDLGAAGHRARIIMDQVDAGRIAALLDDFNALA